MPIAQRYDPACPLAELTEHPDNPRRGDEAAIDASMAAHGFYGAVLAQESTGRIIAGNHRTRVARRRGETTVPTLFLDVDDDQARRLLLVDNRSNDLASYDDAELARLLQELDGLAGTGYSDDDLQALLDQLTAEPVELATDPDELPEAPPPTTVRGDRWVLGEHRLVCGDATIERDVAGALDGAPADMVWTDPPYGVEIVGGNHELSPEERLARGGKTIVNDGLSLADQTAFLLASFTVALRICRPGAVWFVAAPAGPLLRAFGEVLDGLDIWRQTLAWVKDSLVMGRSDYHYRHELLFYGWAPGGPHHAPAERTHDTVWNVPRPRRSEDHPTMKPVALVTRAIENHTRRGAVVLDPFAGSGTTLIAAHLTGRRAGLVELDPVYCDVICRRFQRATGVKPERAGETVDFD